MVVVSLRLRTVLLLWCSGDNSWLSFNERQTCLLREPPLLPLCSENRRTGYLRDVWDSNVGKKEFSEGALSRRAHYFHFGEVS